MAEIVAGAVVAEEVISYTAYLGIGAYMVAKPTVPLKATFSQIATSSDDSTRLSLTRTGHTLTIVQNKAYLFGGTTATDKLSSNDLHAITLTATDEPEPQSSVIPAIADHESDTVPAARTQHAATAVQTSIAIFGGVDEVGALIDQQPSLWLFHTTSSTWESLLPANPAGVPTPRSQAHLFAHNDMLVLYGGVDASHALLQDVWTFSLTTKLWTSLPAAPVHAANAAVCDGVLYLVSSPSPVSSDLHFLPVVPPPHEGPHEWATVPFPTSPLTPGPRPRAHAALLPVSTGYGRNYLLYLFGQADPTTTPATYFSDVWTYQLPSSAHELKPTTTLSDTIKPAKIKDAIRGVLGMDSGNHSWAEVEVMPPSERDLNLASEGKVHPGPRGVVGADVMADRKGVVVWGGRNPKGEREGDGWMIRLE